jgi:hypothetical protein|tara:strand:- start:547 stop:1098 length:552 start_codon:yes stop_codon:yes gene_type:complete
MKDTKKTMVLAGTEYQIQFNRAMTPFNILEYSNVLDITRAWKVKTFECWLSCKYSDMAINTDVLLDLRFALATDDVPDPADYWRAGDNRIIGFKEVAYNMQERTYKGAAYTGAPTQNINVETYMKPDHIIQTRLDIATQGTSSDFLEYSYYDFNYIIELEEVTITPNESIIFNIKGRAQDLAN